MKTILCALACCLLPLLANGANRGPDLPDYPADRITDGVYVIHGPLTTPNPDNQGFMNNPGLVLTSAGLVIIDPGASVQSGEMVLRVAARLTKMPVVAVFNTHIHGDHWLGNQAILAAYPEARIYGHPNMIELIANGEGKLWVTLMEQLTQGKTQGTEAVGPSLPVNHGDAIQVGDHTFRIHHYGPAHTSSDIMIELAQQHTVFLGDNVLNGRIPRLDGGSITGSTQACSEILKTGATHYVPGHGKSGDAAVVKAMYTYFDTLYRNVGALYEEGLSDFEMKDTISEKLSAYADWEDFDVQLGKHISFAFLQIESVQF